MGAEGWVVTVELRHPLYNHLSQLCVREVAPWAPNLSTNPLHDKVDICEYMYSHFALSILLSGSLACVCFIGPEIILYKTSPNHISLFCLHEKKAHKCSYNSSNEFYFFCPAGFSHIQSYSLTVIYTIWYVQYFC